MKNLKRLMEAARDAWLKGYDAKVDIHAHDETITVYLGGRKLEFTDTEDAWSHLRAGLMFLEPDATLAEQRRAQLPE